MSCDGTNVHMRDRSTLIVDGVQFIGSVLGTDYMLFGDPFDSQAAALGAA